jgi:DNA-binding winged helix-turn-helix (wHTH) protein/tetratricopeptide (TPR) repeat protein
MHASGVNHRRFSFGAFVLDVDRGALLEEGEDVPLRPKTFEVLNYLVRHAGLLVSKEDLHAAVWSDVVVTDDSLTHCLIEIRKALGDDSRKMVLTVRGRGYLFDLPVVSHERDEEESRIPRDIVWSARLLAVAATFLVIAASFVWWGTERDSRQSETSSELAVVENTKTAGILNSANNEAMAYYQKGKYLYSRRGPGDNELAIQHFRRALAIDPGLVDALAGLAGSLNFQVAEQKISWEVSRVKQAEALEEALRLDPSHAEAHIRMSNLYRRQGKTDLSLEHSQLAWRYGQSSALVLSIFAGKAADGGDYEKAILLQRRAAQQDPLGYVNRSNLAHYLYRAGHLEAARVEFQNAAELSPKMEWESAEYLALILLLQQKYEEVKLLLPDLQEGLARDQIAAMTFSILGPQDEAEAALARLVADGAVDSAIRLADLYAFRRDTDEAMRWLGVATNRILALESIGWNWEYLDRMFYSPFFQSLRSDPRWIAWRADTEERSEKALAKEVITARD